MSEEQMNKKKLPSKLQFFSVDEVAVIMMVNKKMVQGWIKEGLLPAFRTGPNSRILRIRYQDLEEFVDKHTKKSPRNTGQK